MNLNFPVSRKNTINIKYPDRNRGNQHSSNIAAEGDDHARQTQTVPRWNVFRHSVQKKDPSLSRAQRWMSVQQYACNYTESCHGQTRMCDQEFICLQEISGLSRSVLNCLARHKTRDSRRNIMKTRSDVPAHKKSIRVVTS